MSVDQDDNDPVVLLTYIAVALARVSPLDAAVFDALASSGASIEAKVVPRLGAALAAMEEPVVLVLDDVHTIENPRCIDAIVTLAGHLPPGSRLVLSTRDRSALPLGLLRARALSLELGPNELRMVEDEARDLMNAASANLSDDDMGELLRRTEGWPAGLYLAALSARSTRGGRGKMSPLTGNDPFVTDFLRSEFLARLPPAEVEFLTRTSILDRLSGPLCDAVLESTGSARLLETLERSNAFVVSLDRDQGWYRCHHLVRELLAAELARSEPDRVSPLLGRAFTWCAANKQAVAAIRYAQADRAADRVAAIMEHSIQPVFQSGRITTVERWFAWLDEHGDRTRYPAVAVIGGMFFAATGQPTESDRWGAAAEHGHHDGPLPDGSASIDSWRALLRAYRCRSGLAALQTDAALAVRTLGPKSPWRPPAMVCLGLSELLSGSLDAADDMFVDAREEAKHLGASNMVPVALAERALIAVEREEWAQADVFAEEAVWAAHHSRLEDSALNSLVWAVAARTELHAGRTTSAHKLVARARDHLPQLTYALPVPAAQARLELARTYLAMADRAGAGTMLREVDAVLRRCPDLGTLPAQAADVCSRLSRAGHSTPGASSLTAAELRVLPLLATHLTFKMIGERLYLSFHTVKSHSISIYRKLDVTSRSAAVDRARELGLL